MLVQQPSAAVPAGAEFVQGDVVHDFRRLRYATRR
jgi:hypothetical protein